MGIWGWVAVVGGVIYLGLGAWVVICLVMAEPEDESGREGERVTE